MKKKLTRAEEELMQVLWKIQKGFLKDIMSAFPEPKPAQSTVSTVLRILEKKKFIAHKTYGKSNEYYPLIPKEDYAKDYFHTFLGKYFNGSFEQLLNFFMKEGSLSMENLDEVMKQIEENKKPK
jgi:BlaI family penicillinase repressor